MSDPAYILSWDTSLVGDEGVTAALVRFPAVDDTIALKPTWPLEIPEPVCFEANLETVRKVDYPDNDVRWQILSKFRECSRSC